MVTQAVSSSWATATRNGWIKLFALSPRIHEKNLFLNIKAFQGHNRPISNGHNITSLKLTVHPFAPENRPVPKRKLVFQPSARLVSVSIICKVLSKTFNQGLCPSRKSKLIPHSAEKKKRTIQHYDLMLTNRTPGAITIFCF